MKSPKYPLALAAITACASVSLAGPATNLPPIIVEASRVGETEMEMPVSVQVLTQEDIAVSGARNLPELLEKRSGLHLRHMNANPLQSSLAMRGFGENSFGRVLILVDGERLNNPDMEAPNLMRIPLGAIDRVEIIDGPQTILYGDAASAGVINIRTVPSAGAEPKTILSAGGGSWDTYGASIYKSGGNGKDAAYSAGFDWLSSAGYRQNGGYDLWNANGAVRKDWRNDSFVLLSVFANRSFYDMPGALSQEDYASSDHPRKAKDGSATKDEADLYSYGVNLSGRGVLSDTRRLEFDTSVARRRRDATWRGLYPMDSEYDSWTVSFTPRYVDETPLSDLDNVFLAGGDFHADWYDVETVSSFGTDKPEYSRYAYAGFLRDELYLLENLSFIAGVRGERFESEWKNDSKDRWTWNELAWEAGVDYRPVEELKLFTRASRFYRAPFCDEMNYVAFDDSLEPETGYSFDAGATWRPLAEVSVTLSGYCMTMEDELFFNPYADNSQGYWMGYNENSPAKTRRTGFDFVASWKRAKTGRLSIAYHFVDARFTEGVYDDNDVPLVPEQVLQLSGDVYLCEELSVGGACRFLSSQSFAGDFHNANGELPGYGLVDGRIRLEPSCDALQGLSLEFTVANICDRKYSDFAGWSDLSGRYYYPGAGRSYFVSARYEF